MESPSQAVQTRSTTARTRQKREPNRRAHCPGISGVYEGYCQVGSCDAIDPQNAL
jgi:hypothetical protein